MGMRDGWFLLEGEAALKCMPLYVSMGQTRNCWEKSILMLSHTSA